MFSFGKTLMLLPPAAAPLASSAGSSPPGDTARSIRQTLRAESPPRTAGRVPIWGQPQTARQQIQHRLAEARAPLHATTSSNALALREDTSSSLPAANPSDSESFGFFDLLDVVNPLQHLPIVGFVYRKVTGDSIKPLAQIAGGGLYGGLPGAAASIVNVAVEEATGRDIAGNVIALVDGEQPSGPLSSEDEGASSGSPEARLTRIARAYADLPGTTLGVANLALPAAQRSGRA